MVHRIYIEKKPSFAQEAASLLRELREFVGIERLSGLRLLNRYDAEKILTGVWKDLPREVVDEFVKTSNGSTRTLVKLMSRVHQTMALNQATLPNMDIITAAGELLMR